MNSIETGAIFLPRGGQDLSRNAFVVSILFPGGQVLVEETFFGDTKKVEIFMNF